MTESHLFSRIIVDLIASFFVQNKKMQQSVSLYRSLLKASNLFSSYNFKEFSKRKVRERYNRNRNISGSLLEAEIAEGNRQLKMLKRQGTINRLYDVEQSVVDHTLNSI